MSYVCCLDSVKLTIAGGRPLPPAGLRILGALDFTADSLDLPLVITCGTEGHAITDPHTRGCAFDVRARDLTVPQILQVKQQLARVLGPEFVVLYECPQPPDVPALQTIAYVNPRATAPHFHIQLKKGLTTWPIPPNTSAV